MSLEVPAFRSQNDQAPRRLTPVACLLLVLVVFAWSTWTVRGYLLDDVYIHLKYARNLITLGEYSFNPGQPSFGSSSPLYVLILTVLGLGVPLPFWPTMAKVVSVAAHGAALVVLWRLLVSGREDRRMRLVDALLLMLLAAVPSAARWLQNGMETSLGVLASFVAAAMTLRWRSKDAAARPAEAALTAAAVALPVLVRIEGVFVSACALALIAAKPRQGRLLVAACMAVLVTGWFALVLGVGGEIVPDAGFAKQSGNLEPLWTFYFLQSMGSVSPLWMVGPLLLLVASAVGVAQRRNFLIPLMGLLPILAIVVAGTLKGQAIQGARYFLPTLAFCWGAYLLSRSEACRAPGAVPMRADSWILAAGLAVSFVHAGVTLKALSALAGGQSFEVSAPLRKPGLVVASHEVGYLGWKTDARIIDLAGNVNGREVALLRSSRQRFCAGARTLGTPDVLMLYSSQAIELGYDPIQFDCAGLPRIVYRGTGITALRHPTITAPMEWKLWLREPDGTPVARH